MIIAEKLKFSIAGTESAAKQAYDFFAWPADCDTIRGVTCRFSIDYWIKQYVRGDLILRLYTIENGEKSSQIAVEKAGRLYCLRDLGLQFENMNALICHADLSVMQQLNCFVNAATDAGIHSVLPEETRILAPIEYPLQDVLCVGLNYTEHIEETKQVEDFSRKEATVFFSKRVSRALGMHAEIPDYDFVDSLDYEVELGVILGKSIKDYKAGRDPDPVFGYTVINDLSARNVQFRHKQWYRGKSLDGYTSMGPCIVTADEAGNVQNLEISCSVNGQLRQHSNTRMMMSGVQALLEEVSQGMTLKAGTVMATGTPGGVALGMAAPQYLRPGDTVACRIERIGTLGNRVQAKCKP